MSTTFYIYEVPGHKAGATKNWKGRSRANFNKYSIEPILLETMEGPDTEEFWQVVGDREWELADQNGYKRGEHYLNIRVRANHNNRTTSHFVRTGSNNSSPGAPKWAVAKGGSISGRKQYTCPYCGKIGRGGRMKSHINTKFCQK